MMTVKPDKQRNGDTRARRVTTDEAFTAAGTKSVFVFSLRGWLCVCVCRCIRVLCWVGLYVGPAAAPRRGGGAGFRFCCTRGAGQGASGVWSGDGVLDRLATPLQTGCILASSTAKGALSLSLLSFVLL